MEPTLPPVADLSPEEINLARRSDQERRIRLLRQSIPAFSVLLILLSAGIIVLYFQFHTIALLSLGAAAMLASILIVSAWWPMRQGRVSEAVGLVSGAVILTQTAFAFFWWIAQGLDGVGLILIMGYAAAIAVSGLLGTRGLVVGVTLIGVVSMLLGVWLAPGTLPDLNRLLVSALAAMYLIAIGLISFVSRLSYQAALHELGQVQVGYDRTRRLDGMKDQFITSVNHELRTPVMAVVGFLDLYESARDLMPQERRDLYIQQAIQAGQDLVELLNSILDAGRMNLKPTEFEPEIVHVLATVERSANLVNPREAQIRERELYLTIPGDLYVWGHPVWFQQIMTNLLSNAVKYSTPGSPIRVTALKASQDGTPGIEIRVRDYGFGIPPDQIPLLFHRFARLERDLASTIVGNGLGLYLCKQYTEQMGGKIWVESVGIEGEGSTFFLWLPIPPSSQDIPKWITITDSLTTS